MIGFIVESLASLHVGFFLRGVLEVVRHFLPQFCAVTVFVNGKRVKEAIAIRGHLEYEEGLLKKVPLILSYG